MAFQLMIGDAVIKRGGSVIGRYLPAFDTLDDSDFYNEWDDMLHYRSALEFVREQMNDAQRAELDTVDAYWRANASDFNTAFAAKHSQPINSYTMKNWVQDEFGDPPFIPRKHWWWRPLKGGDI